MEDCVCDVEVEVDACWDWFSLELELDIFLSYVPMLMEITIGCLIEYAYLFFFLASLIRIKQHINNTISNIAPMTPMDVYIIMLSSRGS